VSQVRILPGALSVCAVQRVIFRYPLTGLALLWSVIGWHQMTQPGWRWYLAERMCIAAARALTDAKRVFVGIEVPSTAANLARRTHAGDLVLIY
jgi:hypothetical protein